MIYLFIYYIRHVSYGGGSGLGGGGIKPHLGRSSDTIVLRKIPKDLNTITKLSGYFEKFGNIVNLQVRVECTVGSPPYTLVMEQYLLNNPID